MDRAMTPMATKMPSMPRPMYLRFLTKFIGSKFIPAPPYMNKLRIMPPAMTEAI